MRNYNDNIEGKTLFLNELAKNDSRELVLTCYKMVTLKYIVHKIAGR